MKTKILFSIIGIILVLTIVSGAILSQDIVLNNEDKTILINKVSESYSSKGEEIPKDIILNLHVSDCKVGIRNKYCVFSVSLKDVFIRPNLKINLTNELGSTKTDEQIKTEVNLKANEVLTTYLENSKAIIPAPRTIPTKGDILIK